MVNRKNIFFPLIVVLVLLSDQLFKSLVAGMKEPIHIAGEYLKITFAKNIGATFGLFKGEVWLFIVISILVISFIICYYENISLKHYPYAALILGGALSNLADRIRFGYVIDYINVKYWSVFNVADAALTIGALVLVYLIIREK